jgi:hypothetical protein
MASAGSSEMKVLAATVVDRLRRRLVKEQSGKFRVEACLHYGAVDIDPKYLVVWLLLAGAPDDELPEWLNPGAPVDHPERNQRLDSSLLDWLEDLRRAVRDEFERASWPNAGEIDVLFDSENRVREGGGFWYFK